MESRSPTTPRYESASDRLRLAKGVSIALLLLGAFTSYLGVATLEMTEFAAGVQLGCALVLTALAVAIASTRPSPGLMKAGVIASTITISAMLATADDFGTTPFFYLWPTVFAAYFASARFLLLTLLVTVAALTVALVVSPLGWAIKVDVLVGTTLSVGGVAALVGFMRGRAERLHLDLQLAAHTDPLTGLLNRRAFDPELRRLIDAASAADEPLSVVMLDLDHFKRFNDQHGHIVGDEALCRLATILVDQARLVDLVVRFGGEEFIVVLPGVELPVARSFAERVAWALGVEPVESALRLSASSGVAALDRDSGTETPTALLTRADQALYAAKDAGRARAAWWTPGGIEVGDEVDVPAPVPVTVLGEPPVAGPSAPLISIVRPPADAHDGGRRASA